MQVVLALWAAIQTWLSLSPPTTPMPRVDLTITPTWNGTDARSLACFMIISAPSVSASQPFLEMIMEVGKVPSNNYTGPSRIKAADDLGDFELSYEDRGTIRTFSTERDTYGDVQLRFEGLPRYVTKATPPGPRHDMREQSGGLLGTGTVFIPSIIDSVFCTDQVIYNMSISWDLTGAPAPAKAVWTWGEGDHVNHVGPIKDLINTVYGVAPQEHFHSKTSPDMPDYGLYWFSPPSSAVIPHPKSLGKAIGDLFSKMAVWFEDPGSSYRVFLRTSPRGFGGGAYEWSFILETDDNVYLGNKEQAAEETYFLVAHEMIHNWPLMEGLPGGKEDPNATWYSEGIATYYAPILPYELGLISRSVFLRQINLALSAYYTSPAINMSSTECTEKAWSDNNAQRLPYYRGVLYLLQLNAAIMGQGKARSLKEPVLELLRRRRQG